MSFDFRIGAGTAQSYSVGTENAAAVSESEAEKDTTRLTIGKDGDKVSISKEGQNMLASMKGGKTEESSDSDSQIDEQIKKIQEQIEKIKQELEELKQDPEKNKEQISAKENQLMQLQGQLSEMTNQKMKSSGAGASGGTRAEGFSSSLT